jgi:hypothetical protein
MDANLTVRQAAKAYEAHCTANGKPQNHQEAKELLYVPVVSNIYTYTLLIPNPFRCSAGFAGAFVDHVAETKGLDFVDKEKAKHAGRSLFFWLLNTTP